MAQSELPRGRKFRDGCRKRIKTRRSQIRLLVELTLRSKGFSVVRTALQEKIYVKSFLNTIRS